MKKLKFLSMVLFAVLACVSFSSCSDDDKDEPKLNESIIGVWELMSDTGSSLDFNTIEFKSDKTAYITSDEGNFSNNTYELNGNKLRINLSVQGGVADDYTDGTYALNGNTVTYNIPYTTVRENGITTQSKQWCLKRNKKRKKEMARTHYASLCYLFL